MTASYISNNISRILLGIALVFLAGCTSQPVDTLPQAQTADFQKVWTTVGSDGTVDEADAGKVMLNGSAVQVGDIIQNPLPAASQFVAESAVIRYNVTAVDGLFDNAGIGWSLRYVASGPDAQVTAKLIEVNSITGAETVRLSFDSNNFPAATDYQIQGTSECPATWNFNFEQNAYYIEAILIRNSFIGIGAAGIERISIGAHFDCKNV